MAGARMKCLALALVRVAAVDGMNDPDAATVLVHLLEAGVRRLVRQISELSSDAVPLVLGELTVRIRSFPWRRRTRAHAAICWPTPAVVC